MRSLFAVGSGENVSFRIQTRSTCLLIHCGYSTPPLLWKEGLHRGVHAVCLTRLDADHALGIAPLLLRYQAENRRDPLQIIGPPGTTSFVQKALELGDPTLSESRKPLSFLMRFQELKAGKSWTWQDIQLQGQLQNGQNLRLDFIDHKAFSLFVEGDPSSNPASDIDLFVQGGHYWAGGHSGALDHGTSIDLSRGRVEISLPEKIDPEKKLAAQIAHDLRSPLAALRTLEKGQDPTLQTALQRIEGIVERLAPSRPAFQSTAKPATSSASGSWDAILIDDDVLVHMTWQLAAKNSQKKIQVFFDPKYVFSILNQIPKSTPIYIDSNLDAGVRGEIIARQLYDLGYQELYLATGSPKESFPPMNWIKAITGKDPPFGVG